MTDEYATADSTPVEHVERTVINLRPTWQSMLPYLLLISESPDTLQRKEIEASLRDMAIAADKYVQMVTDPPKTMVHLYSRVLAILPESSGGTDNDGQIVIYSGFVEGKDGAVISLEDTILVEVMYNVEGSSLTATRRFITVADANTWLDELGAATGVEDIALISVEGADESELHF